MAMIANQLPAQPPLTTPLTTALATTVPVFRPDITDEEIDAVAATMRSGWIGPGPRVTEFEVRFALSFGVPHAVAVASGTAVQRADRRRVDAMQHDRRSIAKVELARARADVAQPTAGRLRRDVEARAERPSVAGQHDHADFRVAVGLDEPLRQLAVPRQ